MRVILQSLGQIWVLTREELRDLIFRRRAFLSLLLYFSMMFVVVAVLAYVERSIFPHVALFRTDHPAHLSLMAKAKQLGLEETYSLFLKFGTLPGAVVVMQFFSLIWLPSLISLVSCDMVAIDIYRGTLRYLVTRTSRACYFAAKLLAHLALYLMLQAFTLSLLFACCALTVPDFKLWLYANTIGAYFLILLPYLWFVLATTQFVSCWSTRPTNAVIRLHLLWVALLVLVVFAPGLTPLNGEVLRALVYPFDGHWVPAAWQLSVWAAGFGLVGMVLLNRRAL